MRLSNDTIRAIFRGIFLAFIIPFMAGGVYYTYRFLLADNIKTSDEYLFIKTGWNFEDLIEHLQDKHILKHIDDFIWVAKKMEYNKRILPGRYSLSEVKSNRELVLMLRSGNQKPLNIRFENIRLPEQLAATLANQLEPDSLSFIEVLEDEQISNNYGFDKYNFLNMFIPNTYEFYWNTSPVKFLERMKSEYDKFWTEERLQKAESIGLSANEVGVLASIVRGEALHNSEMSKIAGLYINRLQKGMLLQADPTVIFANKDFSIRRVLHKHLTMDSPYNTYKYKGLPPGPIMMPSIAAIDAVLNYEHHDYIFMCAKEDFSGFHNFAKTSAEHSINARKFQQALNERNIMR